MGNKFKCEELFPDITNFSLYTMCEILFDLIFSCCLCFCDSEDYEPLPDASCPPNYGPSDAAPPPNYPPNYSDNTNGQNYPPNYQDNASNYPPNYSEDNAQNYPPNW